MKRWTRHRLRAFVRHEGPTSLVFRRRVALLGGAVVVGLVALIFAWMTDRAYALFEAGVGRWPWAPLLVTPLGFAGVVWITRRYAPLAAGSGIPQAIAASRLPAGATGRLVSMPTAILKCLLTSTAVMVGGSVGREGPTVQISAAILSGVHRLLRVPMRASVLVAGGAAGVAAAFNTPLAGITFAIEEMASAYEQRMAMLVITTVIVSGMVTVGLAGNYVYFGGGIDARLALGPAVVVALVAGFLGGLSGGLFARGMLAMARARSGLLGWMKARPVLFAGGCGLAVALLGIGTGLTWGTGYDPARALVEGQDMPLWLAPAKFAATLVTSVSGVPGGIFAPSLSTGASFGYILRSIFPGEPASAVVLMGMVAYFTGVVRSPLTAVIIITETTGTRGFMLPLLGAALIADSASQMVCKERLYHGLAKSFMPAATEPRAEPRPEPREPHRPERRPEHRDARRGEPDRTMLAAEQGDVSVQPLPPGAASGRLPGDADPE